MAAVEGTAGVVDARGADNVFFILENMEVTRVYEDLSLSSSSENGLNEVRLATSSDSFALLWDLASDGWTVLPGCTGELDMTDNDKDS